LLNIVFNGNVLLYFSIRIGGNILNLQQEDISDRNSTMSFLLCFFFGYFGAHKFYAGKWIQGLAYLLFGIPVFFNIIITPIADKFGGFPFAIRSVGVSIILSLLVGVAILYDLFAITNESSTDKNGLIIISGKHKDEICGRTESEKFDDKLNTVVTICVFVIFVIIYFVLLKLL